MPQAAPGVGGGGGGGGGGGDWEPGDNQSSGGGDDPGSGWAAERALSQTSRRSPGRRRMRTGCPWTMGAHGAGKSW